MLRQLAAIVPEVTNLPGDLRQVRLFRSNSLSSDRSYRSRQQPAAALRGGALRAAAGRPCLCTFGASEGSSSRRLFRVGEQVVLFRSRKQPAAALRGGALRAAAGRPCLCTFGASEGSSSRRLFRVGEQVVLFRSRQQPAAALRGGALRATAGRPCLCTFGASEEFITAVVAGWRAGCFVSLTPAACGCAPRGRTSCGAQSRLPWHLRASEEFITAVVAGRRAGCFVSLTPAAFGCAPRGRNSCGAQSRLPWHLRASEEYTTRVDQGRRTARRRRTSCSTTKNAQPQAACVSATNLMASEPWSLWFYVLQDPDAPLRHPPVHKSGLFRS